MTTALVQDGGTVVVTTTGDITNNSLYALGVTGTSQGFNTVNGLPVVSAAAYTTGQSAVFKTTGVYTLSKKDEANSSLKIGDKCFWRATGGVNELTGLATAADGVAGVAWAAAATGDTEATIKLLEFGNYAAI